MSQAQLAKKLGVQKAYVTHWEAGRSRPDLNLIPTLCSELGISIAAFFNAPASADSLSEAEQRHIEEYRSISARDRIILDTTLSKMAEIAMTELWDRCRTQFHVIYHNYQQAAAGTGIMLEAEDSGEPVFIRNTRLSDRADEIVIRVTLRFSKTQQVALYQALSGLKPPDECYLERNTQESTPKNKKSPTRRVGII